LTAESHRNLQAQLVKLGVGATHTASRRVIIKSRLTPHDDYVYQPLYGERAAFRLKGVVKAEDAGLVVGVGRVSTVAGELKDEECEASITLYPNAAQPAGGLGLDERSAMDLPTRLKRADVVRGKSFWKGRILPQRNVMGRDYAAESRVTFTAFPFAEQVVVDGYVCSSDHVNDEGGCGFDRASLEAAPEPAGGTEQAPAPASASSDSSSSTSSDEKEEGPAAAAAADSRECPVCKYMKGGPCKEQFLVWDACVQGMGDDDDVSVCFPVTVAMMACMRQSEYYDVMTANAEAKMKAAEGENSTTAAPKQQD